MKALGAEDIVFRDSDNFHGDLLSMTKGRPVDVVADLVGGPLFSKLLNVLRLEGRYTGGCNRGPRWFSSIFVRCISSICSFMAPRKERGPPSGGSSDISRVAP